MSVYLTVKGRELLMKELKDLNEALKKLSDEKNQAYHSSGDTWHDNPIFNGLEQEERRMAARIREKQKIISGATVVNVTERNTEEVVIGSIVRLQKLMKKDGKVSIETWEIVGYSESDPENKKLAYNTPLGSILIGMKKDDEKENSEGTIKYKVLLLLPDWGDEQAT